MLDNVIIDNIIFGITTVAALFTNFKCIINIVTFSQSRLQSEKDDEVDRIGDYVDKENQCNLSIYQNHN